jgi:hypothetical protein
MLGQRKFSLPTYQQQEKMLTLLLDRIAWGSFFNA